MSTLSTNVVKKVSSFPITINHTSGDKWQSKKTGLANFALCSSIVKSVFDCLILGEETKLFSNRNEKYKLFLALVLDSFGYVFSIFNEYTG